MKESPNKREAVAPALFAQYYGGDDHLTPFGQHDDPERWLEAADAALAALWSEQGDDKSEGATLTYFPYPIPAEAVQAATKRLWDSHHLTPEHSEEIVRSVIDAAMPWLNFSPLGDNHHNADVCPYCRRGGS